MIPLEREGLIGKRKMLEVRAFFAAFLLGIVALAFAQSPPSGDPFVNGMPELRGRLDGLPTIDLTELKFQHALESPRYQLGLFGNSRAIQVGRDELRLSDETFFNFSIPGTSFRQSIVFLEALAAAGKAPRVALISFDNAALQYYANAEWPTLPLHWRQMWGDVWHGLSDQNISVRELLRVSLRHVWTDWNFVTRLFSMERLKARLNFSLAKNDGQVAYRSDGSRRETSQETRNVISELPTQPPAILPGYLSHDLKRLAALRHEGLKIIVYESPMAPGSYEADSVIERTRAVIAKQCRLVALSCLTAPDFGERKEPPYWQNQDHAPAALLGPWLSKRLEEHLPRTP
jgi:hypothetical protein